MTDHVEHAGSGPNPVRQANSHVHMIASDPVTGDILVSDLGSDTVFVYALDRGGRLAAKASANLEAVPGSGPRHLAFHPDGRHLFIVNELDSTVCALRRDDDRFVVTDRMPTRSPRGAAGQNLAGAIRVTPSAGTSWCPTGVMTAWRYCASTPTPQRYRRSGSPPTWGSVPGISSSRPTARTLSWPARTVIVSRPTVSTTKPARSAPALCRRAHPGVPDPRLRVRAARQ